MMNKRKAHLEDIAENAIVSGSYFKFTIILFAIRIDDNHNT